MSGHSEPNEIRASVLYGPKDLRLETRTLASPEPTELQIAIKATGLCGSDLHYFNHYRNGDIQVKEPMSLGHESAGVVVKKGSSVSGFNIGDRVALEVGLPCGECEYCTSERYNICEDMRFRSSAKSFPHFQGTLQERVNHPAAWCHKLPENLPMEMGALLEPLGVAIHAIRRAQLRKAHTVVVFGAGAVGLLVAAMAKISEASNVIIADIDEGRVGFAVDNGFAHSGYTVPMKRGSSIDEDLEIAKLNAQGICQSRAGSHQAVLGKVDRVFECTGVQTCVQSAIFATKPGGKVLLIGMGTPVQTLPISAAALREIDIIGVFRYANTYPTGIDVMSQQAHSSPDLSKLVTHRFNGFEALEDAFMMAGRTKDESGNVVLKVMVQTTPE